MPEKPVSKKPISKKPFSEKAFSLKQMSSEPLLCTVNGQEQNSLCISDRGLAFGDGVFETILFQNGKLVFFNAHLNRMALGLERLKISIQHSEIHRQLDRLLDIVRSRDLKSGIVKIVVTRGLGRGYLPTQIEPPTVVIAVYLLGDFTEQQTQGIAIVNCQYRLPINAHLSGIKHLNRLDNVLASLEVSDKGVEEGLLYDQQNRLVEAVSRNVFLVIDEQLLTPQLDDAGVNGVLRQCIIDELAPSIGLKVKQTTLSETDVESAKEIFLCNSVTGIWPVIAVDQKKYIVGSVTHQLQKALDQQLLTQGVY